MNNDALEKGFERLKSGAESLGMAVEKTGSKIKLAFAEVETTPAIENAIARLRELQVKFAEISTEIQSAPARRNELAKQLEDIDAKADVAKQVLYEMQNAARGTYTTSQIAKAKDNVAMYTAQSKELETQIKRLDAETNRLGERSKSVYSQMEAAQRRLSQAIASEANKQAAAEERAQAKATKATEREAEKKKKAQEKAYNEATKGAKKFANRFGRILSGALIFNALSSGLRQLTSYFGSLLKTNSEFTKSFAQLKGAFLTAVQPIYEVVAPALTYLVQMLTTVMQVVSRFVSLLTGKSTSAMAQNAKAAHDEANAIGGVGSAAKEAQKQLAGFDEINRLSREESGGGGGGGSSGSLSDIEADFDLPEIPTITLDEMIVYTAGTLVALGVILAFSGANIPLGIGMMLLGASMMYSEISENWGAMDGKVKGAINKTLAILGIAGLVIGAILCFSGVNIPLGIGLMVMGAAALGTAVALNWETMKEKVSTVASFLLALLSGAALVLGVILAFTGVNLPLAVALIAVGATALVSQVAPRWSALTEKLKGEVGIIAAIASGALIVLGLILCAMGVSFPLGVALIAAGAAGLVGVASINASAIVEWVQNVWEKVKEFWNTYIAPVFTLAFWKNLAISAGNGLIAGFEGAINGVISAFEKMINWIVGGLNNISITMPDWVPSIGGKSFGVNIPTVSFDRVSIPRLAQGAVIPPNKEFLAVLGDQKSGTNIEAPLETIQEAVALVMEDMTGGMMAGFESNLAALEAILQAILGIELDGETISKAVDNYKRKMAVVRGG